MVEVLLCGEMSAQAVVAKHMTERLVGYSRQEEEIERKNEHKRGMCKAKGNARLRTQSANLEINACCQLHNVVRRHL